MAPGGLDTHQRFGIPWLGGTPRSRCAYALAASSVIVSLCVGLSPKLERPPAVDDRQEPAVATGALGGLPMLFEENLGQTDAQVAFLSRGPGYTVFLAEDGPVLSLTKPSASSVPAATAGGTDIDGPREDDSAAVVAMEFVGAAANPTITGSRASLTRTSYFAGRDPAGWKSVPSYERVDYRNVYPATDVAFYGNNAGQLEYDVILAPGADPLAVGFRFRGTDGMSIGADGELVLETAAGTIVQHPPLAYQDRDGARHIVASKYVLRSGGVVGFELAQFDPRRALVIDPVLTYSTLLGGSGQDEGQDITLDEAGNMYITGDTSSVNFPLAGDLNQAYGGARDAFVAKLSADGTQLLFSAFLGGTGEERARSIAIDAAHNVYIAGATFSTDYPTTPNSFQPTRAGDQDAYVTKLNPTGDALVYSTYIGGTQGDGRTNIAVDAAGEAHVSGFTFSTNFPMKNAIQPLKGANADAWVLKLNAAGNALIYSTYLGGNQNDTARGITFDSTGSAFVSGWSFSSNFPVTPNAYQRLNAGAVDAFVAKLTPEGTSFVYSTYVGGTAEDWPYLGASVVLDAAGNAHVTGGTNSPNFPTVNALQSTFGGQQDAFVFKLAADGGSLLYSTYMGGSGYDQGVSVDVDSSGSAHVIGYTNATNFPTVNPLQATRKGGYDAFVAKLNPSGVPIYSTYLGGKGDDYGYGIDARIAGVAHIVGFTQSADFPLITPYQSTRSGTPADIFIAKIASPLSLAVADAAVTEGAPAATAALSFAVSLSPAADHAVTINYATTDGTATSPGDYASASGTLTFAAGETTKTVPVTVNGDGELEANETLTLVLSNPTGAVIQDGSGTGTITDDDTPSSLAVADAAVIEGAPATTAALSFAVSLSPAAGHAVTINYATTDGTATSPGDYASASGTLTFAAGETTKTVPVTVNGDGELEANETLTLVLSNPTGAVIQDGSGTGTITDDDNSVTVSVNDVSVVEGRVFVPFTFTLSQASSNPVTVRWKTINGSAVAPADYRTSTATTTVIQPGQLSATINVGVLDDSLVEGPETFTVTIIGVQGGTIADGSGMATILDND